MNDKQRAAAYAEAKRSFEQHVADAAEDPNLHGERRLASSRLARTALAQMKALQEAAIAAGDPAVSHVDQAIHIISQLFRYRRAEHRFTLNSHQ